LSDEWGEEEGLAGEETELEESLKELYNSKAAIAGDADIERGE
jgi:hypothetical protein